MTNEAIEKIKPILNDYFNDRMSEGADQDIAEEIDEIYKSLGYVQPKFSEDLEKAITEFAKNFIFFKNRVTIDDIRDEIKDFLSANRLVQKVDQSLPENIYETIHPKGYAHRYFREGQQSLLKPDKNGCVWRKVKELK